MVIKLQLCLVIPCLVTLSSLGVAQPATFENSIFKIPQGAALIKGEALYYNDIQMAQNDEGNFTLIGAKRSSSVYVDSVSVILTKSLPPLVSLFVRGNKSIPCVELQPPAIFKSSSAFTVALAETSPDPAEMCIQVLAPFETQIPLDITGLDPGTYSVNVNGTKSTFTF